MSQLDWKQDRLEQLERTVLELGTELYRLKNEIGSARSAHNHFLEVMKGLKMILDEKGLISLEDFENAVDLGNAISGGSNHHEYSSHEDHDLVKKTSH